MTDNGKRPLDRIDQAELKKVAAKNRKERLERSLSEGARRQYQKFTNDDYAALLEKFDRDSDSQEWWEWRISRKLSRKTRRHLASCDSIKALANCKECPSRKDCKERGRPCPMLELYLQTSGHSTETLATDKIITEADWRPSNRVAVDQRSEFFSKYVSGRPALGEVARSSRGSADPTTMEMLLDEDIMAMLLDGKLPLEQIAAENYVALDYVRDLQGMVLAVLGCHEPALTEGQKIQRAIILDRLTTRDAAQAFNKKPSHISRLKRKALKTLAGC